MQDIDRTRENSSCFFDFWSVAFCCTGIASAVEAVYMLHKHWMCCTGAVFYCRGTVCAAQALGMQRKHSIYFTGSVSAAESLSSAAQALYL